MPLCSVAVVDMRANAGETWRRGRAVALAAERCAASGHAGGGEPDAGDGGRGAVQQHQDALGGDHEGAIMDEEGCMMMHRGEGNYFMI